MSKLVLPNDLARNLYDGLESDAYGLPYLRAVDDLLLEIRE